MRYKVDNISTFGGYATKLGQEEEFGWSTSMRFGGQAGAIPHKRSAGE
ncbi:hypothetical protein [Ferribacterium limneticum]|nr:hypothetical protein [Ferribacterium limneticum]UCV20681.1 hypothetical protein KI610_09005 [Ferribacterium limneticum]